MLSARSPSSRVAFHPRGARRVVEATYFGMLFICWANTPNPGASTSVGQTAASPSYVLRPSTIASAA